MDDEAKACEGRSPRYTMPGEVGWLYWAALDDEAVFTGTKVIENSVPILPSLNHNPATVVVLINSPDYTKPVLQAGPGEKFPKTADTHGAGKKPNKIQRKE